MQFPHSLHLVGIKGSGMSALACLLHDWGNQVTGSDVETYYFTQTPLEARGIAMLPFAAENIQGAGVVIHSAAYGPQHPEIAAAVAAGLPVYSYPAFIGLLSQQKETVSVAGAHGKTSTTSLVAAAWAAAGQAPSAIVGDGTGYAGTGTSLILESCEYRRHFLHYRPADAILLNVDFDHPDYFADLADVKAAFREFAAQVTGHLVICGDDPHLLDCVPAGRTAITYGFGEGNDYRAAAVSAGPAGSRFAVLAGGESLVTVSLWVPGRHNILNALGVVALAHEKGLDLAGVAAGLAGFRGARRRFEVEERGAGVLVDDYAHHPVEIAATLQSARERFPDRRIVACFQPHTFSRTEALFSEFATALRPADRVCLLEIFASAREQAGQVSSRELAVAVGGHASFLERETMASAVAEHLGQGDVVLLMGAGDINKIKSMLKPPAQVV